MCSKKRGAIQVYASEWGGTTAFINQVVETQARRDRSSLALDINPAMGNEREQEG